MRAEIGTPPPFLTRPVTRTAPRLAVAGVLRGYLDRRSALELAFFDGLLVAAGLWITLPAAASLDGFWIQVLVVLSPGLLLLARSLVAAVGVPGVFSVEQLDPEREIEPDPRLDEARHLAFIGVIVLGVTGVLATAALGTVGVAVAFSSFV